MGNRETKIENNCIEELSKINEEELDISRIDKLQIKAIKEMTERIKQIEDKKSDKILYKLPVQICNYSLI